MEARMPTLHYLPDDPRTQSCRARLRPRVSYAGKAAIRNMSGTGKQRHDGAVLAGSGSGDASHEASSLLHVCSSNVWTARHPVGNLDTSASRQLLHAVPTNCSGHARAGLQRMNSWAPRCLGTSLRQR
jgi:hypothetical protein